MNGKVILPTDNTGPKTPQNVIGGQPAVLKLVGKTVKDMTLISPAGVKFSLGEGPKNTYGKKDRLPSTRMGSAFVMRNALIDAEEYARKQGAFLKKQAKDNKAIPPKRDLQREPLARLLKRARSRAGLYRNQPALLLTDFKRFLSWS